jgi:hypothetical protein
MVLVLMTVADPAAEWVRVLIGATVMLTVASGVDAVRSYVRARRA